MKKLLFLIFLLPFFGFSQNPFNGQMLDAFNTSDQTWTVYQQFSPTSVHGNRYEAVKVNRDTMWFRSRVYKFDSLVIGKTPIQKYEDRIMSIDNDGYAQAVSTDSIRADWNRVKNKPNLFSGDYNDLTNKPSLFDGDYNSLSNKPTLFSGAYGDLTGKPTLFSGDYNDLSNKPTLFSGSYLDLTDKPSIPSTTSDISEGSNLYWTNARFDTRFSTKTTTDLTEGSNLYWTSARFNTSFSGKSTTDLSEGTNLYWTTGRFNTAFGTKTTTDLAEGSNQYFTTARSRTSISTTGNYISYDNSTGVITSTIPTVPTPDYYNTVAVAGGAGNAVFYLTSDKTSGGTALYTTIDVVIPIVNDASQNYTYGWSYNPTTKALTVNCKTNLTAVITLLTVVLGPTNASNGTNIQVVVKGH